MTPKPDVIAGPPSAATVPERVKQRIFRVPVDRGIPEGWRFVQWLGKETNLAYGSAANFEADVVLCEVDEGESSQEILVREYGAEIGRLRAKLAEYDKYVGEFTRHA